MNNTRQDHDFHRTPTHNTVDTKQLPYWKRAHRDWRFWSMLILMLIAILFYVITDNFALLYRSG